MDLYETNQLGRVLLMKARSSHTTIARIGRHLLLLGFVVIILAPFLWSLNTSLKPLSEILSYPPTLFPAKIFLGNYINVLSQNEFRRFILNSAIVTLFSVILTLLVSLFAGYAAARYNFPAKEFLMLLLLAGMAIGRFANVIPLYFLAIKLKLFDTYLMLVLAYSAFITPLITWLMQSYFKTIPVAIEEAAKIDGCNTWKSFWMVVVPIMKPPIVAGAVITMSRAWNEFILALTLTRSSDKRTLPVGLHFFLTDYGVEWGPLTAASILSIIPILIVFLWLQRYFLQGFTSGTLGGS